MQAFLVLGLIPGTNIQINFLIWLIFLIGLGIGTIIIVLKYRHQLKILARLANMRVPLHASELHTRQQ
jgi:hypothetical protein